MSTLQAITRGEAESLRGIERELATLFRRIRRQTELNARRIHPELQPTGYSILLHVLDRGPARAAHIVDDLGIDKGAVSRHVAQLAALGLIERTTDPSDGRAQTLVVSDLGRSRIAALRRERRSDFAGRLAGWTEGELAQFAERLGRYNASLES